MVGVPGRSGGCATCRRRKRGCDKKTPFCGQCVQNGLVCEGYSRQPLVWINSTDGESRLYTKTTSPGPTSSDGAAPRITLNDSLMRSTREDRYVDLFLTGFLPNGRLFSRNASQISSAGWLRYHEGLCRSERTLRFITLAHGLSMLATRDNNNQLKVKGVEAHRMALQEMRQAMQSPSRVTGDGILAAVRLFRFYEILYGAESDNPNKSNARSQIKGYYAHTDGEMALFMNRGCHKEWSEAGRSLLASGRIVSFIMGVSRRKASPFHTDQWLTAPWKNTKKSPLEELSDILVQIPSLLQDLDTLRTSPMQSRCPEMWKSLLGKLSRTEKALLSWRINMRHDLQTYDYTHFGESIPAPEHDRDFAVLNLSFFYWSSSVVVYTTFHMVMDEAGRDNCVTHYSPIPFSSPGSPNYLDERNPTLHARRIVHALPLSYRSHAGGYAALSTSFPLGMALRYLVVAHLFPHENNTDREQMEFLRQTVSQPYMGAYIAKFIDHLHKVDTSVDSLKEAAGWSAAELRARGWWFGPRTIA